MLTLVDFHCGAVEKLHDLWQHGRVGLGYVLRGHGEHGVAAEYGHIVVPLAVHGGLAAAHVGFVHHVVVQKGEVVKQLYAHSHVDGLGYVAAQGFASEQREHRAQAFASECHGVGNGVVEPFGLFGIFYFGNGLVDQTDVFFNAVHGCDLIFLCL